MKKNSLYLRFNRYSIMRLVQFIILVHFFGHLNAQKLLRENYDFFIGGKKLLNPLTGGINNAQVSYADLNSDGDKDLFIFDRDGDVVIPMIYDRNLKTYIFYPSFTDNLPDLKVFAILKDYNKDGIIDIFASSSNTQGVDGIEVYQGYYNNKGILNFKLATNGKGNTLLRWPIGNQSSQIYVSNIDLPTFDDIDRDGDLDILTFGNADTHVSYFKNIAIENGWSLDSLNYVLETNCYGGFREGGFTGDIFLSSAIGECNNFSVIKPRHAGSTLLSTDLNSDNLPDLLIGDLSNNKLVALYNGGNMKQAWMNRQTPNWPDAFPVNITVFNGAFNVDYNHDGIEDIIAAPNQYSASRNFNNVLLYEGFNDFAGRDYRFIQENFLLDEMLDFGGNVHPVFVDYNQDGLMDIVIGTEGFFYTGNTRDARLFLLENRGSKQKPEFHLIDSNYLDFKKYNQGTNGTYAFTPCFGDLDSDGDLDMLVGENYGALFYCENIAGPGKKFQFKPAIYNYQQINVFANSVPRLVDLNRDGLLDIVCGMRQDNNDDNFNRCSSFTYYQNQGSPSTPIFNSDPSVFPNTKCPGKASVNYIYKSYSTPVFMDFNGTYKLFSGSSEGKISIFGSIEGNVYSEFKKEAEDYGKIQEGDGLHIDLADIDDDGILELITGNNRGGIAIYKSDYRTNGIRLNNDDRSLDDINVYPNPFDQNIYFVNENGSDEEWIVELWNVSGSKIYAGKFRRNTVINTNSFQGDGIIIVKLTNSNKTILRKMIRK